jgi:hypothetical protein
MKDEPVDLGPLKLSEDPVRRERLKARIRAQARQELARRAARDTLARALARWFRPVLVGSGLVFAHAIAVLLLAPASRAPADPPAAGSAFGIPPVVGVWLEAGEGPELLDLMALFEGERR